MTLKIAAKSKIELTKQQLLFNKLTTRIESLEKEIVQEDEKLTKLLELYHKEISPNQIKVAHSRIQLAMALGLATEKHKFNKKQIENIRQAIIRLCESAFTEIEPTAEQEAFFDSWSEVTYKEGLAEQARIAKEMFSDYVKEEFDIELDPDEFGDTPEEFARIQNKIKEKVKDAKKNNQATNSTKKQKQKEEAFKAKEALKNRSIRGVFIALAKVLHPDSETDITLKSEKEELMKQVTVAYDEKDLSKLLKLEIEWVHKTSEHLEKLTEENLNIYILALKQQVAELEQEREKLTKHPRFTPIRDYSFIQEKYAISKITNEGKDLKKAFKEINAYITIFKSADAKSFILDFINAIK